MDSLSGVVAHLLAGHGKAWKTAGEVRWSLVAGKFRRGDRLIDENHIRRTWSVLPIKTDRARTPPCVPITDSNGTFRARRLEGV
jgi:hypothetical protein